MPANAGIHVFLAWCEDVDGRDRPGHDERKFNVMPANAGIHVFLACGKDVDGRDKPGHDE